MSKDPTGESTAFEAVWSALEGTDLPGEYAQRLIPGYDLNAIVTNPAQLLGLRLVVAGEATWDPLDIVGTQRISFDCSQSPNNTTILTLRAKDKSSDDMFKQICEDLVRRVAAAKSEASAFTTFIRRFASWQAFLKRETTGLSASKQRGLYGELLTLRDLLVPTVGSAQAVTAWTGPNMAPQDFQLLGVAIEVKTAIHSQPQKLKISGERQLDDFGISALVIAHHRVTSQNGEGETLPALVGSIRKLLLDTGGSTDAFDDKLLTYGHADHEDHLYGSVGYATKVTQHYRVRGSFPRITDTDLLPGVGELRYSIDASACAPYTVESSTVAGWLQDPPSVEEPDRTPESDLVEYKQTAWTPVGDFKNQQHEESVRAAVRTAIVKTVVAFMNSHGGELVVGVKDDQTVTGIELDLVSRDRPPNDLDWYEQELVQMLSNMIDTRAPSQVRIRFEKRGSRATCHVSVRPSPTPRFGRRYGSRDTGSSTTFWVRSGNTTVPLEGPEMMSYVFDHWT